MFRKAYGKLLDFIFPQHLVCHCCGREAVVNDFGVCAKCESELVPFEHELTFKGIDGYTAGLVYNTPSRNSILALKFGGALYQKELLVHFMRIPDEWQFDIVVPVPLHRKRRRSRGYNQSEILAKELCKRYNLELRSDVLIKSRNTPQQSRLKAAERKVNLHNAYTASKECRGLSVLLVDDVRTTGSTLSECAMSLRKAGAVKVYAITACCAVTGWIDNG